KRQTHPDLFAEQLTNWLKAAASKTPPLVSGEQGRRSIQLIEDCYKNRGDLVLPWDQWNCHSSAEATNPLRDRLVAVTGATGVIGGRLVDRLLDVEHAEVRTLVRGYRRASRLARNSVEMVTNDLSDVEKLVEATRGCDVLFHSAHD